MRQLGRLGNRDAGGGRAEGPRAARLTSEGPRCFRSCLPRPALPLNQAHQRSKGGERRALNCWLLDGVRHQWDAQRIDTRA